MQNTEHSHSNTKQHAPPCHTKDHNPCSHIRQRDALLTLAVPRSKSIYKVARGSPVSRKRT